MSQQKHQLSTPPEQNVFIFLLNIVQWVGAGIGRHPRAPVTDPLPIPLRRGEESGAWQGGAREFDVQGEVRSNSFKLQITPEEMGKSAEKPFTVTTTGPRWPRSEYAYGAY